MQLEVRRAPARNDDDTGDPTVDFGAEDLASSPVRDHSELIQVSQRGWEGSDPKLTCPERADTAAPALTRPLRDPQTVTEGSAALRGCRARFAASGIDVDAYTYVDGGRDVLDLIRALDLEHVNLTSGYMRRFPRCL